MQKFGSRVQTVGPNDRPCFLVHASLPEVVRVAERLTQRAVEQERAVDVTYDSVIEFNSEPITIERLNVGHTQHAAKCYASGSI